LRESLLIYIISHSFLFLLFLSRSILYWAYGDIERTDIRTRARTYVHTFFICLWYGETRNIRQSRKLTAGTVYTRKWYTHALFHMYMYTHMRKTYVCQMRILWNMKRVCVYVCACACIYIYYTHIHPMHRVIGKRLFESEDSESSDSWRLRISRHRNVIIQTNTFSFIYSLHVQL